MKPTKYRRSGLTLTELLVVVAIIVIVTSVLAPLLSGTFEGREIREAARQINAYFQQAQARAKELNRPVGVMIRRSAVIPPAPGETFTRENDLDFGFQLSLAEVPPPYTGFSTTAKAHIELGPNGLPTNQVRIVGEPPQAFTRLVAPNDFIRFSYRGPKYRILAINPSNLVLTIDLSDQPRVRFAPARQRGTSTFAAPLKFEIFRRPQAISSTPLELPTGSGIVMNLSGVGLDPVTALSGGEEEQRDDGARNSAGQVRFPRQKYIGLTEFQRPAVPRLQDMPITIMFNPSGGIERVYRVLPTPGQEYSTTFQQIPPKRPQDKIYLFVGRQGVTRWENLDDGSNLWIVIDPQTGLVTTAPNTISDNQGNPLNAVGRADLTAKLGAVATSRQLAATGQSLGGQ